MNRKIKAKMVELYGGQFGFAREMGLHESHVSRVICGHRPLKPEDREKWAKALNCKPEELK